MERPNLRPTVVITTYSESALSSAPLKKQSEQQKAATKSEFSTDFFNKFRSQARGPIGANQILLDLSQIRGPSGSIRGHKDVVRKSLEGIKVAYNRRLNFCASTFLGASAKSVANNEYPSMAASSLEDGGQQARAVSLQANMHDLYQDEYLEQIADEEHNQCVAYTTSLGIIRRTFEDSKTIKSILDLNLIEYEERDIFLNQEYKQQLKMRLESIVVPALFVDGKHVGGLKELDTMNENGELLEMLSKFKMSSPARSVCPCCGNAKFIACQSCNGSRKSTIHHFKFNSIALRCIKCDKNAGIVQCPVCSAPATSADKPVSSFDQNNNCERSEHDRLKPDQNCNEMSAC